MKFETFCAANSGSGFISFFPSILDEKKKKVYYIKGGPGSGKSTFLRQIAMHTENAELIKCSGDPSSLDGVILPDQNAVIIDATAPHCHEPAFPGVGGNIIDLGTGWDPQKMQKETIIRLTEEKREIYKNCYALLKGAKQIHQGVFAPLEKELSLLKLKAKADKILIQNALWEKRNQKAIVQKRFLSALSSDGCTTLSETFALLGKNVIVIEDRWMISHIFLQYLEEQLTKNGIDHINCYHPLFGEERLQHLIIPQANLSIVTRDGLFSLGIAEENIFQKIALREFLNKEAWEDHKNKLTFIKRILRETIHLATDQLNKAREIHMMIECEYAKGTDFELTVPLKEKIINNIFAELDFNV